MSSPIENATPINLNDQSVVDVVLSSPEIRKMPPGSEEFKTAVNAKLVKQANTDVENSQAAPVAPEEPKNVNDDNGEKPEGKLKYGERIKQLRDERENARKEAEELRKQLEEAKANRTETSKETEKKVEVDYSKDFDKPKPDMNAYKTVGEYTDALTDWKLERRDFINEQKAKESQAKESQTKVAQTWDTRQNAVQERIADYEKVVNQESIKILTGQTDSARFLADSDHGPEVLYKLLADDDLAEKFDNAPAYKKVAMLGALEADIVKSQTKSTAKGTSNPPPKLPPKLGGSTAKVSGEPPITEVTDFAEYSRIRAAQEKARKASR